MSELLTNAMRYVTGICQWHHRRTEHKRQTGVWKALSSLKINQEMSADEIYGQFDWQVSGPLFREVDQVEETLRTMLQKGLVEFTTSGNWKLRREAPLSNRFAGRF